MHRKQFRVAILIQGIRDPKFAQKNLLLCYRLFVVFGELSNLCPGSPAEALLGAWHINCLYRMLEGNFVCIETQLC